MAKMRDATRSRTRSSMYFHINVLKLPMVYVYEVAFLCYNKHCAGLIYRSRHNMNVQKENLIWIYEER